MTAIPADVTPEDLARWTAEAEVAGDDKPALVTLIFPKFQPIDYRVRWCAAQWLARSLEELGCDPELNTRICFANGQICFHGEDAWAIAQKAVDDFRRGRWERPGHDLARRLFHESMPRMILRMGPPNMEALGQALKMVQDGTFPPPGEPFPYDAR